ncbi:DUF1858 domain-containing protein [Prolixibacteraceae bacterium]|nr:DUF1858 domain-containing protein [Prolixibacteraceae bacterium]
MHKLIITPKTKVLDLINTYPDLEDVLIEVAPPFKKLKNPVLRKVIAKVTTLSQAAVIGGLKVEELILRLRKEVGQEQVVTVDMVTSNLHTQRPEWYDSSAVKITINIRESLNQGEQPMHDILSLVRQLNEGEIVKVISPFVPAPIIDKTLSLGYKHWLDTKGEEEYWIFITK